MRANIGLIETYHQGQSCSIIHGTRIEHVTHERVRRAGASNRINHKDHDSGKGGC